jgi:hypothetical protein
MYDNYNYPAGADTPDAPWNQPGEPDPIVIEATVNTTLFKNNVTVETSNYDVVHDDDFGDASIELNDGYSDVEKYYTEQHKSILELLEELAKYIKGELAGGNLSSHRRQELEMMLEDCQGWKQYSFEVEEFENRE